VRQVQIDTDQFASLENGRREEAHYAWPTPVRQRALVERITVNGDDVFDASSLSRKPGSWVHIRKTDQGFETPLCHDPVGVVKAVAQRGRTIEIAHRFENRSNEPVEVEFSLTSEWVPSYLTLLLFGRESVELTDHGARNALTGAAVEFQLGADAQRTVSETLFGLLDRRTVGFTLGAGETHEVTSRLCVTKGREFGHIDRIAEEWPSWCGK
jgi:hypothetical protein